MQGFRDFFGNKRFDSRDLYSYDVKSAKPAIDGGYVIELNNGNTVKAEAVSGGGFNFFTPNGPVDADLAKLYTPVVEAAIAKQKGK